MIKGQRARTDRGSPLSDRPWRLGALVTGDFQCAWGACSVWCQARVAGTETYDRTAQACARLATPVHLRLRAGLTIQSS
jgi:hypothetical protein